MTQLDSPGVAMGTAARATIARCAGESTAERGRKGGIRRRWDGRGMIQTATRRLCGLAAP